MPRAYDNSVAGMITIQPTRNKKPKPKVVEVPGSDERMAEIQRQREAADRAEREKQEKKRRRIIARDKQAGRVTK